MVARFLVTVLRPFFWLLFPYRVRGREHARASKSAGGFVLCANHLSNLDPVYLMLSHPRLIHFMAKAEIFRPFIGRMVVGGIFQAFPVNRGSGERGPVELSQQLVKAGKVVGIFPEGHRSKDGQMQRAKSGAALIVAQTGADILPVYISAKGGRPGFWRMTTLTYGAPISPAELRLDDPGAPDIRFAARELMTRIAALAEE